MKEVFVLFAPVVANKNKVSVLNILQSSVGNCQVLNSAGKFDICLLM